MSRSACMSDDVVYWLFGIECGMIECGISSIQDLRNAIDSLDEKTFKEISDYLDKEYFNN